ncbi:IS110 family transposase [Ktedonobacter sp. SOSP1-52]|uniref:IS110 family transposase n=1 Tax=Ktedonobacter sp. SOSP1-52 TaxID=2778366 RepID=UPI0019152B2F|nr:IS110 family transposase [Ktedonobacter sp. SOSP1-52]GHO63036.1 IS110 family transposase [Ktedonobacter sp. SOSP1-52]
MSNSPICSRFVALDVHKQYVVVGALDAQQHIVLSPKRMSFDQFEEWSPTHLYSTDAVVLEATTNAWDLYDRLQPLVASVTIAHPLLVKLISAARVKTDARDTLNLARLLAAGLIPAVWVPPEEVRELRALVAHRRRLIVQRTQARNRLQSVLHRHNIAPPEGGLFAAKQQQWWNGLPLSVSEKLRVRQDLTILTNLIPLLEEVEVELSRLSSTEQWANQVPYLVQLPGIGILIAMVLLSAIGDVTRFPSAKHLVGYAGLGASVHASGQTYRTGAITKQGRRELRMAMVEAAWTAVEHHPHWKAQFDRLSTRLGKNKAIVAIARKLLVVVWHVLTHHKADRYAEPEKVALKFVVWSRKIGAQNRAGLKTREFVRGELVRLKMGEDLETIGWKSTKPIRLPSQEEGKAFLQAAAGG